MAIEFFRGSSSYQNICPPPFAYTETEDHHMT